MNDHGGDTHGPYDSTSYHLSPPQPPTRPAGGPVGGNPYAEPARAAVPAQGDPGARQLVAGRYRLLGKLGHGGMGTVWRAEDETVDRVVAVKEPRVPDHLPQRERETLFDKDPARRLNAARVRELLEQAAHPPQPPTQVVQIGGGDGRRGLRLGRRALTGLGAGVVVLAVAACLVLADPFAGPLPDGWKTHREKAPLKATVAVPDGYVRIPGPDDDEQVTYADPSGAITVELARWTTSRRRATSRGPPTPRLSRTRTRSRTAPSREPTHRCRRTPRPPAARMPPSPTSAATPP
jgi:hypothetical protein